MVYLRLIQFKLKLNLFLISFHQTPKKIPTCQSVLEKLEYSANLSLLCPLKLNIKGAINIVGRHYN